MRSINKIIVVCCVLMVLLNVVCTPVMAASSSQIDFTMLRYEPMPAEPGKYVNVFIKVENPGNSRTDEITIEFADNYPFRLADEDDRVKNIGSLGIDKEKSIVVEYRVIVDNNAVEGTNDLKLNYYQGEDKTIVIEEVFNIDIQTSTKIITISNVVSDPVYLSPGSVAEVMMDIKNLESSKLYDLKVSMDFSDTTIPFSPFQSVPEKHINIIGGDESRSVTFNLIADPDAVSGIYNIPVSVNYEDSSGTTIESSYTISLVVNAVPKYKVDIKDSPLIAAGERGKVILSLSNIGSSEIKYLNLELLDTESYNLISVSSDYLGNVGSDDFETSEFEIKVNSDFSGSSLPLKVKMVYADSFNKEMEDTVYLNMKVYSVEELAELGVKSSVQQESMITTYLMVVPIAILLLAFWVFMLFDAVTSKFKKKGLKVIWIVLLVTTHLFGAFAYFFTRNKFKVLEE
ncbi:MAG: PLDc N-terminal domain-containing protein [Candidatus Aenigmarchaeota archaeon]|nr:PLDc N-terminal domain-containing protein [Candidatus Aenigmarchaeota archaeon]